MMPRLRPRHRASWSSSACAPLVRLPRPRHAQAIHAGEHIHQGGLAGAGLADDAHELAGLHLQVDAFQSLEISRRGLVRLDHPAQADQRGLQVCVLCNVWFYALHFNFIDYSRWDLIGALQDV